MQDSEGRHIDVQGYPSWELCLQCTEEAGRGLILPIVSKEPLSDKKLKQKDYLGSMIFPILELLLKTTSAKPGGAGTRGIPWTKDSPNNPTCDSPVRGLPPLGGGRLGPSLQPGLLHATPCCSGIRGRGRCAHQKAKSEPAKGMRGMHQDKKKAK